MSESGLDNVSARPAARRRVDVPSLASLPLSFEENRGQFPPTARFVARTGGVIAAFTARGVSFASLERIDCQNAIWHVAAVDFCDGEREIEPVAEGVLPGRKSYFRGADPSKWQSEVPLFTSLRYPQIAPGIDLVLLERDGALAYDLHVESTADVAAVEFTCHGGEAPQIGEDGALTVATGAGTMRHSQPKAWFEGAEDEVEPVVCRFDLRSERSFGFTVDGEARGRKLVIDPGLVWATYFGGQSHDRVTGIDVDSGVVTIVGHTVSLTTGTSPFPIYPTNPAQNVQVVYQGGNTDAFVARLDPAQSGAAQLIFSTYLGGDEDEEATDVAIDMQGNVVVCGWTDSGSVGLFPTTALNAYQPTWPSGAARVGFVSHLTISSGPTVALDYSTYFGGDNGWAKVNALDLRSGTTVTFTGPAIGLVPLTNATALDTTNENESVGPQSDAFVGRIDWTKVGSASLVYSTFLSPYGTGAAAKYHFDEPWAVAYASPNIYVAGETRNSTFPVTSSTVAGQIDAMDSLFSPYGNEGFVVRIDPTSTPQWRYATYVGGDLDEIVLGIDVHQPTGSIYACGWTTSSTFPISAFGNLNYEAPAYQSSLSAQLGGKDAFIVKIRPGHVPGQPQYDLRYGTYLGGGDTEEAVAIARIGSVSVAVVGYTYSDGTTGAPFPTTATVPGADSTHNGAVDAFLTELAWSPSLIPPLPQNPVPAMLRFSTFYGSSDEDFATCLVLDSLDAYFGGQADGLDLPVAGNPFAPNHSGQREGFAARFSLPPAQTP